MAWIYWVRVPPHPWVAWMGLPHDPAAHHDRPVGAAEATIKHLLMPVWHEVGPDWPEQGRR